MFEAKRWTVPVDDAALDDLRARLRRTQWPDEINDAAVDFGTLLGESVRLVVETATRIDTACSPTRR
jgi:hypothetical protein